MVPLFSENENLLLVKMKEENLLKIQPLPKVMRVQAIRSKQLRNTRVQKKQNKLVKSAEELFIREKSCIARPAPPGLLIIMAEIAIDEGSGSTKSGTLRETLHEPSNKQPQGSHNHNADKIPEGERPKGRNISEEAERIAQLLTISPDLVNITVNVGFNTKVGSTLYWNNGTPRNTVFFVLLLQHKT